MQQLSGNPKYRGRLLALEYRTPKGNLLKARQVFGRTLSEIQEAIEQVDAQVSPPSSKRLDLAVEYSLAEFDAIRGPVGDISPVEFPFTIEAIHSIFPKAQIICVKKGSYAKIDGHPFDLDEDAHLLKITKKGSDEMFAIRDINTGIIAVERLNSFLRRREVKLRVVLPSLDLVRICCLNSVDCGQLSTNIITAERGTRASYPSWGVISLDDLQSVFLLQSGQKMEDLGLLLQIVPKTLE